MQRYDVLIPVIVIGEYTELVAPIDEKSLRKALARADRRESGPDPAV